MFIDFVTLLLVNMSAGLFILALFILRGMTAGDQRPWAAGFAASGVIALVGGLVMAFTWPLPGSYNAAFGELSALFGMTYLAAAACMASGSLNSVTTQCDGTLPLAWQAAEISSLARTTSGCSNS